VLYHWDTKMWDTSWWLCPIKWCNISIVKGKCHENAREIPVNSIKKTVVVLKPIPEELLGVSKDPLLIMSKIMTWAGCITGHESEGHWFNPNSPNLHVQVSLSKILTLSCCEWKHLLDGYDLNLPSVLWLRSSAELYPYIPSHSLKNSM